MENWHKKRTDEKSYFKMCLGRYRLVDDVHKEKVPRAVTVIDEVIQKVELNDAVCWEDLCILEKALLLFLTREEMECRLPFLADMYRSIVGDKTLTIRMKIKISDLKGVSDETLRGETEELIDDMYRHLALYSSCRKQRTRMIGTISSAVLILLALVCMMLFNPNFFTVPYFKAPMIYVIIAGGIGGMIGVIRRIQGMASINMNGLTYIDLKYDRLNILLAPVYGATFSMVLFLLFTSGFLTGDMFPAIKTISDADITKLPEVVPNVPYVYAFMTDFVKNTYPASGADCAKLIVWSFIAGFAEKFVPDALDRLTARSKEAAQKN